MRPSTHHLASGPPRSQSPPIQVRVEPPWKPRPRNTRDDSCGFRRHLHRHRDYPEIRVVYPQCGHRRGRDSDYPDTKSENLQKLQGTLKSLDSHVALFLLKNCFSIPKLTYFLRCSPTFTQLDLLKSYDDIIASILCDISNLQFNELSLDQASLPAHLGGIGISKATTLAFAAFLASASSCRNLSSQILWDTDIDEEPFNVAFALWSESTGIVAAPENPCYQKSWSLPLYEASRDALISKLDDPGKRRITSFQGKTAAAWLSALPSMNLGLKLTDA